MFKVFNQNNLDFCLEYYVELTKPNIIYGDCIYESLDFSWVDKYWQILKSSGIFIIQTDWHTDAEYDIYMKSKGATLINKLVWKNEWGNHPKNKFHQCYDTILVYSKGNMWEFNPDVIQVPKVTKNVGLNPSGRQTKQATAWIDDICLTTTAKERVKKSDGHLAKWQKPMKLYDRIIAPFITPYTFILDPFMGVGTLAKWCLKQPHRPSYFGIELDPEVYTLAIKNIEQEN